MRLFQFLILLLVASLLFVAIGCSDSDDDPVTPPPVEEMARIAIMHDDSTHVAMTVALEAAGYEVTDLGLYADYTGTDFSAFDLVFMLTGYEYGADLPDTVQQGLLDFMSDGGTLVTTEWLGYSENNELLTPKLALAYNDDYCDDGASACIDTITVDVGHPLTQGLDAIFTTPPDYTYSFMILNDAATSENATNLMTGTIGGAVLGIGEWGSGHTIHWNWAGCYAGADIWDANTTRILMNIADFAR